VLALEVMVPNPAIRNLIREDKIHQIYGQMQVGQSKFGMQTMNQALEIVVFTRQFATMIDAGLPLVQCLEILGAQQQNIHFQKAVST
jgi:Tfp pilus assembly pilus retraction ATPase PilT